MSILPHINSATNLLDKEAHSVQPTVATSPSPSKTSQPARRIIVRQRSRAHSFDDKEIFQKDDTDNDSSKPSDNNKDNHDEKDNRPVLPSLQSSSSTQSSLPILSPRTVSSFKYDGHIQSNVQMSFVRVYAGLKTFLPRNKTVVVTIFFQPILKVYEIIIFDILETKEICRLYLYQAEIIKQLRKRCAMVLFNKEKLKKHVSFMSKVPSEDSSSPKLSEKKNNRQNRAAKVKQKKTRRRTDSECTTQSVNKWRHAMDLLKDTEVVKSDSADDIDLDTVDVDMLLNVKTLSSLFFTKVILKCMNLLQVASVVARYQITNDLTLDVFTTFTHIPEELKSLLPTVVDAKTMIAQGKQLAVVEVTTNSLKNSVNSADVFTTNAHQDLKELDNNGIHYSHEDALNPNVLKYRSLWQKSTQDVIKKNQISRKLRCNWGILITCLLAGKRAREAQDLAHAKLEKQGPFRKLQVRTRRKGMMNTENSLSGSNSSGDMPFSVADMVNYREEMQARRKLKKEKLGIDVSKV